MVPHELAAIANGLGEDADAGDGAGAAGEPHGLLLPPVDGAVAPVGENGFADAVARSVTCSKGKSV